MRKLLTILGVILLSFSGLQARAQSVSIKGQVKDVAGLFFSSLDVPLSRPDVWRFIRLYSGRKLKNELTENKKFWQTVYRTALKLYCKEFKKLPEYNPFSDVMKG